MRHSLSDTEYDIKQLVNYLQTQDSCLYNIK